MSDRAFMDLPPALARNYAVEVRNASSLMLAGLALSAVVLAGAAIIDTPSVLWNAALFHCFIVLAASGLVAWRLVSRFRPIGMTPVAVMLGFVAMTFGAGPLIHFVGPEAATTHLEARWQMPEEGVFRVHVLNMVGLSCLFFGMLITAHWQVGASRGKTVRTSREDGLGIRAALNLSTRDLVRGYAFFFGVAAFLRGYEWFAGINLTETLPGALGVVDKLGWVAVLFAAMLVGRGQRLAWPMLLAALAIEMLGGALALSRFHMILPLVLAFVGLFIAGMRPRVLLIGAVLVGVIYVASRPVVDAARVEVWTRGATTPAQFYVDLLQGNAELSVDRQERMSWWQRLDYTPVQYALMAEYDAGRPGDHYQRAHWLFLPRVLFPEKPIINYGKEVNVVVFGHDRSSAGPTIFGEAYWNGGWYLVIFYSLLTGVIYCVLGKICVWLFFQRSMVAWPLGLLGMLTGVLVRNFFTAGLVGATVIFLWLVLMYSVYRNFTHGREGQPLETGAALKGSLE